MNWTQAKRVAQSLVGILLLVGCGGGSGKKAPVSGGEGGENPPVFGGASGENPPVFGGANGGNRPLAGGASGAGYGGNGGGALSLTVKGMLALDGRISADGSLGAGGQGGGAGGGLLFYVGTLSGGGREVVSIGRRSLLGANAGLGIPLGDDCVVEAGLYVTAGTKVTLKGFTADGASLDGRVVKARDLAGASNVLFRRNSLQGGVEAVARVGVGVVLNAALHH